MFHRSLNWLKYIIKNFVTYLFWCFTVVVFHNILSCFVQKMEICDMSLLLLLDIELI